MSNHHSHISTFTLPTWQVYIILGATKNIRTALKNPLIAQFIFKVFSAQTLFFEAVFFWGGWGACISGLPSYLLAYILTNLHPHLIRLPLHLPTYLPRCKPLFSPTCNLGYQLMTKFASTQNYQITKHKITKLQVENFQDYKLHVLLCKFQIYKIIKFSIYNIKQY